jgi:putative DNA primase/helicase
LDPAGMVKGFDAADWTGTGDELIAWAKPRAKLYGAPAPVEPIVDTPEPPPADFPPEATLTERPVRSQRQRPRLAAVDGTSALAPEEDAEALPAAMSEDAIASQFAATHGDRWRYVKPWGSWFEWRGDGWYRDDTAKIDRLAVEITRQAIYWPEAANLSADGKRKVNSRRTAGNVRDIALSDRAIAATVDQWDTDKWLLGVPGGVVNLRDGSLHQPRANDYITKRTKIAPAPGPGPIWLRFLDTVTDGNPLLVGFLQRFAGYSLTGETREQCLAFLYGTGQNGKGVFITTLANILGDYATACDADVFMESDQQRHPTEMARLRGARLVTIDETDSSKRWNEKRIKRITGGGKIEARFMRQDDFEFQPQFKLLIAGNHKPQLRGVGKAIQRRIHLVPFTVTIPDEQRDDELAQKLEAEYPQILQWAIDGCRAWLAEGLAAPPEVLEATSRYIEGEDTIGEWLEERCEQKGDTERPRAYKNYRGWMDGRGERPWSSKAFWAALEEKGYLAKKSNGAWNIQGLQLRFDEPSNEPPAGYPFND